MNIHSIQAWQEKFPLTKPYTIAYKTIADTELIFIEIVLENGITGLGAANPFPEVVGETAATTIANLQSGIIQSFKGRDIQMFQQLIAEVATAYPDHPGTLAAIDIALHDAFGKFIGIPILEYYEKKTGPLLTSITIGIKDTNEMIEEAKGYYAAGFRILKIKTGHDVEEDIERVQKIKEAFNDKFIIRVDANQGYDMATLQQFMQATKHTVELIEQPLKRGDEKILQSLTTGKKILVADESLINVTDAYALSHPPLSFGVYNIKLMKCGGIKAAKEIATIAQQAGIDLFWGCNDESIISITAALHAAYSCSNTKYLDLDGSFDLSNDIVQGGFILKDGYMHTTGLPGLGYSKI